MWAGAAAARWRLLVVLLPSAEGLWCGGVRECERWCLRERVCVVARRARAGVTVQTTRLVEVLID